ncbi:MAG: nucleotidyltransferase domain-containing protein [Mesorhizobium sp.]
MDQSTIISTLLRHERQLHGKGVLHAGLFGSAARGEMHMDSDIDILIDLDPAAPISVYDYVELKDYIASLFPHPVDVVSREGLKPHLRPGVLTDFVHAF